MVLTVLAGGYHGPPELTVSRALTSWTLDLPALVAVLLAGGLYLAGVRRLRRSGRGWGTGRALAFGIGGLGGLVVATMSFLGVYQGVLFYVRSAQTIVLLLVVPLFLVLGAPLTLLGAAVPRAGPRLDAVLHSRAARLLTFPAITTGALVLVPFVLYFSPWYAASLRSVPVRDLTYLVLLALGFVFFWMFLRIDPVPRAYPYLVALWVSAAEVVGDAALGLAVLASQSLLAGGYYRALGRPWGPSLHADQIIGGGVLWVLGDLVGLPFLAAQFIRMMREDESQAKVIDAELDAAEAARAAAAAPAGTEAAGTEAAGTEAAGTEAAGTEAAGTEAAGTEAAGTEAGPAGSQPWWEEDPRFAGRFRRAGRPPQ